MVTDSTPAVPRSAVRAFSVSVLQLPQQPLDELLMLPPERLRQALHFVLAHAHGDAPAPASATATVPQVQLLDSGLDGSSNTSEGGGLNWFLLSCSARE